MNLGIDIGYDSIKIVQLEKTSTGYTVQKIGSKRIHRDLNTFDPENITKSQWVAAIQDLCKELKITPKKFKHAVSSLSGSHISVKQITTLEMSNDELAASLEFEAKKHIPLDGTEAVLDFHVIGHDPKELDKINVIMIATTKNLVKQHNEILTEAGFHNSVFDADPIALINSFLASHDLSKDGVDILMNIGNQTTSVVVWGKNQRFFFRELNFGGHHFTNSIMRRNELDYSSAEDMKIEKGLSSIHSQNFQEDKTDDTFSIQVAEKSVCTQFVDELRKTLRYYIKTSSQAYFNKVYLTGGSSSFIGLKEFIAEQLNVEIEILNPVASMKVDNEVENPSQYAIAIGLGLRGLV